MAMDVLTAPPVRRSPAPQFGQMPVPESMVSSIVSECATASAFYDCAAYEYNASTGGHVRAKDVSVYMEKHGIPTPSPKPDRPVQPPPAESQGLTTEITSSTSRNDNPVGQPTTNAGPDTTRTSTENSHDTHRPSPSTTEGSPTKPGDVASNSSDAPPASIAPVSQPSPIPPEVSLSSLNDIGPNSYPPPHSSAVLSHTDIVPVATPPASTSTGSAAAIEAASASSDHTGAIVGGVLGGLALLALIAATFLVRRRRAQRPAPSAEFMHLAHGRSSSPVFVPSSKNQYATGMAQTPATDQHFVSFANDGAGRRSTEYEELPPRFTPGFFRDPVFEKVQASAEMRGRY